MRDWYSAHRLESMYLIALRARACWMGSKGNRRLPRPENLFAEKNEKNPVPNSRVNEARWHRHTPGTRGHVHGMPPHRDKNCMHTHGAKWTVRQADGATVAARCRWQSLKTKHITQAAAQDARLARHVLRLDVLEDDGGVFDDDAVICDNWQGLARNALLRPAWAHVRHTRQTGRSAFEERYTVRWATSLRRAHGTAHRACR
jgi:hypothetical protein